MTQATAGWYPHPTMAATRRYWDGEKWTEHIAPSAPTRRTRPEPPGTWIFSGILGIGLAVGAALLGAYVDAWGWYAAAVPLGIFGWVAMMAGTIATGIRIGARWVDYERQN